MKEPTCWPDSELFHHIRPHFDMTPWEKIMFGLYVVIGAVFALCGVVAWALYA